MKKHTRRKAAGNDRQRARWKRLALCLALASLLALPAALGEAPETVTEAIAGESPAEAIETPAEAPEEVEAEPEAESLDEAGTETALEPETEDEDAPEEAPDEEEALEEALEDAEDAGPEDGDDPGEPEDEALSALAGLAADDADAPGEDGVWQIGAEADGTISFSWEGAAETFALEIADADGNVCREGTVEEPCLELDAADWAGGPWTLTVRAARADGAEVEASLRFAVELMEADNADEADGADEGDKDASDESGEETQAEADGGEEDDATAVSASSGARSSGKSTRKASGKSSGRSSGKSAKKSSSGSASPGKSAGKGSGKSSGGSGKNRGGSAATPALDLPEGATAALEVNGEALRIALDGGASLFTAVLDDDVLRLAPADAGEEWTLAPADLQTLHACGVAAVELELDGVTYRVEIAELAAETSEADAAEEDEAAGEDEAAPDVVWAVNARGVLLRAGGLEFLWSASTPAEGEE